MMCAVLYVGQRDGATRGIRGGEEVFIPLEVMTKEGESISRRLLEFHEFDFGDEITSMSPIVAGESGGTSITWRNSNITAFQCNQESLTGPVQVLHQEPVANFSIQNVFFSFDGNESLGYYRLDDFDPDINPVIAKLGQPDRVNAAAMYFDHDANESNFPLAAFLFNAVETDNDEDLSDEIFLCRYDVMRIECFDFKLYRVGRGSTLPFVGFIYNSTYFYANGIGNSDVNDDGDRVSRPIFLVRSVNNEEPTHDSTTYYINYAENRALRCADLTGFAQDSCVTSTGKSKDCVVTARIGQEQVHDGVSKATGYLTCIANNALGIVLISLSSDLTPYAYLYIQGIDLVFPQEDGSAITIPPETDSSATKVVPQRLDVFDFDQIGSFGACFVLDPPTTNASSDASAGTRVFCSSNRGHGLWEVDLASEGLEVGYCNDYWQDIYTTQQPNSAAPTCKRFCGSAQCPECCEMASSTTNVDGGKPRILFSAENAITFRNDGLNCRKTARKVPTVPACPHCNGGADPVVIGPQGVKTQFWMPLGKFISVFSAPDGTEVYIRCFGKPGTHSQWIDGIVIKENGVVTVDVVVLHNDELIATRSVDRYIGTNYAPGSSHTVDFVDVKIDGDIKADKVGDHVYRSQRGTAVVELAKHDYPILDKLGDTILISTDAFKLKLFTMPARKFKDEFEAAKWTHLDFKFVSIKDRFKCAGFLCDVMFGTNTVDPELKAAWLKVPDLLDTADYAIEAPDVLAGETNVVYS